MIREASGGGLGRSRYNALYSMEAPFSAVQSCFTRGRSRAWRSPVDEDTCPNPSPWPRSRSPRAPRRSSASSSRSAARSSPSLGAILVRHIFDSHKHFDADELVADLPGAGRRVSRATVYRTLRLLVEAGLLRELGSPTGRPTSTTTAIRRTTTCIARSATGRRVPQRRDPPDPRGREPRPRLPGRRSPVRHHRRLLRLQPSPKPPPSARPDLISRPARLIPGNRGRPAVAR